MGKVLATGVAALAVATVLVLSGCAAPGGAPPILQTTTPGATTPATSTEPAEPTDAAPPPPSSPTVDPADPATPTDPETPSPSAPPVVAALVLPDCDVLVPVPFARAQLGPATQPLPSSGDAADHMPGPAAAATARSALQSRVCTWGIPNSDGGFVVVQAELAPTASADLIAALRSAGTFAEVTIDGAPAFSREYDSGIGSYSVTYMFDGSAWVTAIGSLTPDGSRAVARAAFEGIRAVNPERWPAR